MNKRIACMLTIGSLLLAAPAAAIPVGLELVLAVDVSGSISTSEFNLQRTGYMNAFDSDAVLDAILGSPTGSIAASLVYWSGATQQQQAVGWTLINDAASAAAFASAVGAAARPFGGSTSISGALNYSVPLFDDNGYEGARNVIDVSGDGTSGVAATTAARDNALAAGITVNGIVIGGAALETFYLNNVIGGPDAFALRAEDFGSFSEAIQDKLVREIDVPGGEVPEPTTSALIGSGLLGILAFVRKRR